MPACATKQTVGKNVCVGNLILPVPDTDLREFLDEVEDLARMAPEIIVAIGKDLTGTHERRRVFVWPTRSSLKAERTTCPR